MANGMSSRDLAEVGQGINDRGEAPRDPNVVRASLEAKQAADREAAIAQLDEDLAKANIADEKIKADIKNRGTNALIQGGVAGLQLGAQLQSAYAKSDKGKAKAAERAYEKAG